MTETPNGVAFDHQHERKGAANLLPCERLSPGTAGHPFAFQLHRLERVSAVYRYLERVSEERPTRRFCLASIPQRQNNEAKRMDTKAATPKPPPTKTQRLASLHRRWGKTWRAVRDATGSRGEAYRQAVMLAELLTELLDGDGREESVTPAP